MKRYVLIFTILLFTNVSCSEIFRMKNVSNKNTSQPFGVNLAGAEFAEGYIPGEYGKHYIYPDAGELDYFKSKGLMLIRLPFKWERLQPALFGKLDKTELKQLKKFVSDAEKRRMYIILDLHNYGRRYVDGEKIIIGTKNLKVEHFADFWQKLAKEMKGYTNIYGHGLMNEPHDMEESESCWFEMAQSAITAIRKVDREKTIIVGGDDWSSAERWREQSDTLKYLIDPADKLMFEAHVYFDSDASGSYKKSYDEEGCTPERGIERVKPFVKYLEENNFKGLVGEYGVPHNDERWLETMDNFLSYLQNAGVNATYWAAGPWWGNYALRLTPNEGKDRPQMKIVEKYIETKPDCKNRDKQKWIEWDFDSPNIPKDYRDSSSGSIIASALLELCGYVDENTEKEYFTVAEKQLQTLASPCLHSKDRDKR